MQNEKRPQNVLEYIERIAAQYPDKTAVADRDHCCSFDMLVHRARRMAAVIRKHAAPGQAVGVVIDRSVDVVAGLLGVLYAECFYVPLDPAMPSHKLSSILSDASIQVVIAKDDMAALLPDVSFAGRTVQYTMACEEEVSMPALSPEAPLYMVYTSGSTGKPKGVLKSHGAMISFVEAYSSTFDFNQQDVIGNQTPFFFDAAAKDLYLMMKTGATMEIIPSELFGMPLKLIEYLNERGVTIISWVPTALAIVAQLKTFNKILPQYLRKVLFVGEVMPIKYLNVWRQALPDVQYVNLYGSSEVAGICCYYVVEETLQDSQTLPMGKPLCNCRIRLVRDGQTITQPHEVGEIEMISDALADGYYGDPERTKERFALRTWEDGKQYRCYLSGDLAQYDEEGNLLFAARTDAQIKHRGYRIELGEIETIAGSLPEIAQCVCLYDQDKKRIHLFCQLMPDAVLSAGDIRKRLQTQLSSYMVPDAVTLLEKIPLNANGKKDRQLLRQMMVDKK